MPDRKKQERENDAPLEEKRPERRTVLITGANHGIGAATAKAFVKQGERVFLTAYREETPFSEAELLAARKAGVGGPALYAAMQQMPLNGLVSKLSAGGAYCAGIEADLSQPAAIPRLFQDCEDSLGPAEVLVINHTYCVQETFDPARVTADMSPAEGYPVRLVDPEVIDAHFAVNARAAALLIAEYARRYLDRRSQGSGGQNGRIIAVSTDAAHAHVANVSYAASKHAIESYCRSAAQELGRYGITVNVVAPGPVQTGYITPEAEAAIAAGTPLGRVGLPDDVADVILFLASDAARWITGQVLYVGGGWQMGV